MGERERKGNGGGSVLLRSLYFKRNISQSCTCVYIHSSDISNEKEDAQMSLIK